MQQHSELEQEQQGQGGHAPASQQQSPRQQGGDELSGVVFQHARYLSAAKAMLGQGQRAEAKQLLQAVVAQGLRMLQQQQQAAAPKEEQHGDDLRLGLQQLHVQALLLLGKAHGLAPNESDAAAHCFLLAARGPCPPLRPLALENLRVSFARLAALSGGGGAHRLASLHWDAARHRGLVAAAVGALREQQVQQTTGKERCRRPVILVAGPTAALLALLVARELWEGEAGVLIVEDSRVAATLGRKALEVNGFGVGKADSPVLGFVESRVLLQRLTANKAASGGASVEEGKGMDEMEEDWKKEGQWRAEREKDQEDVVYAGLLFDPFPYTLPTLPLRILSALRRRSEAAFCVPEALRLTAQVVESPELRTLNQAAPEDGGVVDGFQLGTILDALGRRAVPIDPGSFPYQPLSSSSCVSTLLPMASLLPLVEGSQSSLERTWTVPVARKGRTDAVLFWWEAGMLLAEKGEAEQQPLRVLVSCAPPAAMVEEGCGEGGTSVPLDGMHRWQTAWLDFTCFEVDPSSATRSSLQLQLRLSAPSSPSEHVLPLSLHFPPPTPAHPLVDAAQPERILDYHVPMVNDTDRNGAYAAWLRWALQEKKQQQTHTPSSSPIRVLDIGAGSGLLGLMAARFASELGVEVEVVCLEKVPVLAAAAGWAAEENGYGERVTVVNELSSDITAEDLGGRFDILVSEIFGDQPLSESVLPSFRHARSELLAPDARILPSRLVLWATVARIEGLERVCAFPSSSSAERKSIDCDCDWRGWDAVLEQPLSLHLSAHAHTTLLDAPLRLGEIDLAQHPLPLSGKLEAAATITGQGDANALVLWFEVGLGEDASERATINTGPAHGQRPHWKQVVYPLVAAESPITKGLSRGERLSLRASYDRDRLRLQVVGRESGVSTQE